MSSLVLYVFWWWLVSSRCRCRTAWSTSPWNAPLWWMQQELFRVNWRRWWESASVPKTPSLEFQCLLSLGRGRSMSPAAHFPFKWKTTNVVSVFFSGQCLIQFSSFVSWHFYSHWVLHCASTICGLDGLFVFVYVAVRACDVILFTSVILQTCSQRLQVSKETESDTVEDLFHRA